MGVLADKDYSTEVKLIADMAKSIITITPDNPRALPARELAQTIRECVHIQDDNVMAAETIKEAVAVAVERYDSIGEKRLILAFGSLSYMSAVKEEMRIYADRK
jgi:dihydrofolate synthase/folylpolyglutamate synthase